MNRTLASLVLLAAVAGCGGSNNATDMGTPDMAVTVTPPALYLGGSPDAGMPANFACNGSYKDTQMGPTTDTMVKGVIKDFQDSNPVDQALVELFALNAPVSDILGHKNVIAMAMTGTDHTGNYTMTVPAGSPLRVIRAVTCMAGSTMCGAYSDGNLSPLVAAYEFGTTSTDISPVAVKQATKEAIPGLVSVIVQDGTGIVAGAVHDCDDKETGGALISVTSPSYDSTAMNLMFYFVKISGATLPTRVQKWTAEGGAFAALNVLPAPGVATITAKGIVGSGAKQTIGQAQIPIIANAVTIVHLLPLASPAM